MMKQNWTYAYHNSLFSEPGIELKILRFFHVCCCQIAGKPSDCPVELWFSSMLVKVGDIRAVENCGRKP